MKEIRTRFAPSPTGFMHIGGVRTALFSYLIAKQAGGKFILRIEDTDQTRYVEGALGVIYDTLRELGLNWDEGPDVGGSYGPYIQSERKKNYVNYAEKLIGEEKAYYCFCDEERLVMIKEKANLDKVPYKYDGHCRNLSNKEAREKINNGETPVIRFKTPKSGTTTFDDKVYGKIVVSNNELEDLIMIKSDGMPTYNFANIIDDHEMEITHIVRGNEYVSSTPKYVLIYQALNWEIPEFVHLPIIKKTKDSDKKLSKRDGDATVDVLKTKGYLNAAIINMLALTGWSPGDEREIFSLDELVETFKIDGIGKGNAIFDTDKLNWLNNHYIRQLAVNELLEITVPHLESVYDLSGKTKEWVEQLVSIYQDQLSYGAEIVDLVDQFFKDDVMMTEESKSLVGEETTVDMLNVFKDEVAKIEEWDETNIMTAINNTKARTGIKGKMLFMPIRIKVSGQEHGPELPTTIYLLGKELVLNRLNN